MSYLSKIRILLIEDNTTDVLLLTENLQEIKNETFSIHAVATLNLALVAHKTDEFDIVIMDLNLPDSVGLDTFVNFRKHAGNTPVILLTSVESYELGLAAVKMGAQDFMVKHHVQPNLLSHAIRYAIERSQLQDQIEKPPQPEPGQQELKILEEMLSSKHTSNASEFDSAPSLRASNPQLFASIVQIYQTVLSQGTVSQTLRVDTIMMSNLHVLGDELGRSNSDFRDILDIHTQALRQALASFSEEDSQKLLPGSRVAVLSLMGHLSEFYRAWYKAGRERRNP